MVIEQTLYARFCDIVYEHSGLYFDGAKSYFVTRRIEERMQETGAFDARDYFQMLLFSSGAAERQELCEKLTIHETYFFREYAQLQVFAEHCLPEVLAQKRSRHDWALNVWSAGCATGEEPYTLAIILREMIEDFDRWTIRLSATDMSRTVLDTARRAVYGQHAVRDVPITYKRRYFREEGDLYHLESRTARMVNFRHANLLSPSLAEEQGELDIVFCRNVLIYLDDAARRSVVEMFYRSLRPGGYLFLGHSESAARAGSDFELVRRGEHLVCRKSVDGTE